MSGKSEVTVFSSTRVLPSPFIVETIPPGMNASQSGSIPMIAANFQLIFPYVRCLPQMAWLNTSMTSPKISMNYFFSHSMQRQHPLSFDQV